MTKDYPRQQSGHSLANNPVIQDKSNIVMTEFPKTILLNDAVNRQDITWSCKIGRLKDNPLLHFHSLYKSNGILTAHYTDKD